MRNNLKLLLIPFILLMPLGCGEDGMATIDVFKDRINKRLQDWVGKGDLVIKKYDNKIASTKKNLIKVKVSHGSFKRKLEGKKHSLAEMERTGANETKIAILRDTIEQMESFILQINQAEQQLTTALRTLLDNRDLVKLKVAALEAKRDMLQALQTIQDYTDIEGQVDEMGLGMDSTLNQMQNEIDTIEAEMEVGKLFQGENMSF